ncbi:MAG: RNA-directed DNA polymerase [Hyphomonadaceae bacterium]|nr:RNA-directed DNA polymerase [Hyphomonadaceae bacterium]
MSHPWDSQTFTAAARAAGRSDAVIDASLRAATYIKDRHPDLPVILTLAHLAHLTDVSGEFLRGVVDRETDPYRVFQLNKRSRPNAPQRAHRTICVPHPLLMRTQRWIAQNILNVIDPHRASFAFAPKRDIVQAAKRHAGCRWLVKLDVTDFFTSIREDAVYRVFRALGYGALISFELARLCTRAPGSSRRKHRASHDQRLPYHRKHCGFLPQGAPTSPMLANLASYQLDEDFEALATSRNWIYSRYADDLAFSTKHPSNRSEALHVSRKAEALLERHGFAANRSKTCIAPPGARRLVLGLLVDRGAPRLPRAFRDNIETHLYALAHADIGPLRHLNKRGFASLIGMRRHIEGLIAFAHQVEPTYAARLYARFKKVAWPAQ